MTSGFSIHLLEKEKFHITFILLREENANHFTTTLFKSKIKSTNFPAHYWLR